MGNRKSKDEILVTNQNIDKNYSSFSFRKIWQIFLPVGFIGLLVAATVWYAMSTGSRIAEQYHPLVQATMEIKIKTTNAHLLLEEIISGDENENTNKVWDMLNQVEWYTQAMIHGDKDDKFTYTPLDDPEYHESLLKALEKIRAFRNIAKERYANPERSIAGSDIDKYFHVVFYDFLKQADDVKTILQQVRTKDIKRVRSVQVALIVLSFLFTGIIGIILNRYERKQASNLSTLRATNQQLRASEQQLKASEQQLKASEQQLKASNQQLTSSEQQLKASNQQLKASKQQLRATNQELLLSQQRLALHVQQTPLGIIQWDLNWKVSEWNKAAEKIFGYTSDEAIGRHAAGLIVPESVKPMVDKVWNDLIAQKGGNRSTNENNTKDNKTITCEWYNTPLIDDKGKTIGVASQVLDITERTKAEEILRENEEYVRTVLESTEDGILAVDVNGKIKQANQKFIEMWHIPQKLIDKGQDEKLLNYVLEQLTDPEAFISKVKLLYDSLEKDLDILTFKDDRIFERYSCPIKRNGILDGRVWSFRNITERKKVEIALQKSEEKLRTMVNYTYDWEYWVDPDGKHIYVSPSCERITGYNADEFIQNPDLLKSIIHPEDIHFVKDHNHEVLESGEISPIEFRIITKNKDIRWIGHICQTVYDIDGKNIGQRGSNRDITEIKRLQQLESRADRLEMAGTIAGQVAHDFNNLLGPIMAYPELIKDDLPHDHKARAYLDDIEKAAQKIANINQDLLTMGRRGHYNQNVLNLNQIVLQAAKEMELRAKNIICELNLSENLLNIKGGSAQIHRMLTNLFVNAQDAMQNVGNISIKTENYYADDTSISFGRVPKGEYVKLTISDTGCGIPNDIIQKILDPFFSTKTTDKVRGSGLGLSVVDAVLKDHNAYLDLSSKVGYGTSFYIYFPVTREDIVESKSNGILGGNETILLVDDDKIQRDVAVLLLNKLGYKVNVVESGEKAVDFLKNNPQDLVILDMVMPGGIDGAETYERILEINSNQKAIILSGFSESDKVFKAQELGAGAFIKKPITKNVIATAVRTELDRPVKISKI